MGTVQTFMCGIVSDLWHSPKCTPVKGVCCDTEPYNDFYVRLWLQAAGTTLQLEVSSASQKTQTGNVTSQWAGKERGDCLWAPLSPWVQKTKGSLEFGEQWWSNKWCQVLWQLCCSKFATFSVFHILRCCGWGERRWGVVKLVHQNQFISCQNSYHKLLCSTLSF